ALAKSRFEAAITRTSVWMTRLPPTRSNWRSWSTRSNAICVSAGSSPICPASFPAVPGLEVELVDIVLREPERIPQHDHVLQRERSLGCDVLERCDRVARAQPSCRHLGLRRIVLEGARQTGLSHVDGQVAQVDRIAEHDGLHRAPLGGFGRMGTVSWPEYACDKRTYDTSGSPKR